MTEKRQQPLHANVVALMAQKAKGVLSSFQCEKELVELGELLVKSDLHPSDKLVTVRLLGEIREHLPAEGDTRNARLHLDTLIKSLEDSMAPPAEGRLGRTA